MAVNTQAGHGTIAGLQLAVLFGLLVGAVPSSFASYRVMIDAPEPLKKLLTENLDLMRYKDREDLDDEQFKFMLDTMAEQVTQLTSTEGYFKPLTTVELGTQEHKQLVTLHVAPGPRTTVSRVDISVMGAVNNEMPALVEQLKNGWHLPAGQAFRQADWDSAKELALRELQKRRYAAARLTKSAALIDLDDPDTSDAKLLLQFDSGPAFTLGKLNIKGPKRYPAAIINNVNPLLTGEEYSVERLLELQRQIQKTPYYSNVVVSIDDNTAQPDMAPQKLPGNVPMSVPVSVPVNVSVTEVPISRLRAGTGYSSDTGANVLGRYSYYDLFDSAYVFDSQIKLEQERQFVTLGVDMPPSEGGYVNGISASDERTTLQGIDLRDERLGIKRARSFERYDYAYTLDYYSDDLNQIDNTPLPPDAIALPGRHRALVPGFSWARRNVDDPIFPRSGNILALQTGFGLKGLVTDQNFVRVFVRFKQFIPVGKRDLMIFRTEVGANQTAGSNADIPASLLFRAGGTDSVRGYSNDSIGNLQNGTVFPTKYLLTGSAEYQHWFLPQWGGAVFYDAGTATDSWSDKEFFKGVGAGVRWRSPVGPVNADMAYGIEIRQIRPHISLGIAF